MNKSRCDEERVMLKTGQRVVVEFKLYMNVKGPVVRFGVTGEDAWGGIGWGLPEGRWEWSICLCLS